MNFIRFLFSKVFLKNLLGALLLVGIIIFGSYYYLSSYTDHGETIEVPDLKGKTLEEVDEILSNTSLQYEVIDSVYSEGTRGTVLEQLPAPKAAVKEDRSIYLTVNASRQPMKKIKVKEGESFRVAQTKLKIDGIEYTTEYQPSICNDCVIKMMHNGKEITTGDDIRQGEQIKLILGERGTQKVGVPKLFGMSPDSAEKVLMNHSLTLGFPFYDPEIKTREDSLSARVYNQHPEPTSEAKVRIGSPIDVWLTTKPLDEVKDTAKTAGKKEINH